MVRIEGCAGRVQGRDQWQHPVPVHFFELNSCTETYVGNPKIEIVI